MYRSNDVTIYIHDKKSETYPAPLPPVRPIKTPEPPQESDVQQKNESQKETETQKETEPIKETYEHPGKLPEIFQLASPPNPAVSACTIPGYELPSEPSANVEACERDLTFEAVMSRRQRVETKSDQTTNESSLSNFVLQANEIINDSIENCGGNTEQGIKQVMQRVFSDLQTTTPPEFPFSDDERLSKRALSYDRKLFLVGFEAECVIA